VNVPLWSARSKRGHHAASCAKRYSSAHSEIDVLVARSCAHFRSPPFPVTTTSSCETCGGSDCRKMRWLERSALPAVSPSANLDPGNALDEEEPGDPLFLKGPTGPKKILATAIRGKPHLRSVGAPSGEQRLAALEQDDIPTRLIR
jgi:hypothetical protein